MSVRAHTCVYGFAYGYVFERVYGGYICVRGDWGARALPRGLAPPLCVDEVDRSICTSCMVPDPG